QIERADIADGEQRVLAEPLGLAEDAGVQVEVVLGAGLVDVAGAAAGEAGDVDQLHVEQLGHGAGRHVELLLREAGQAARVIGVALLHCAASASSSCPRVGCSSSGRRGPEVAARNDSFSCCSTSL